jgi:hypothetical protein
LWTNLRLSILFKKILTHFIEEAATASFSLPL